MKIQLSLICCAMIWGIGCPGGAEAPPTGSVTGTITVDGKPGTNLQVVFQPQEGRPSFAMTDESGSYSLVYTDAAGGAMLGKGYFSISSMQETEGEGYSDDDEAESEVEDDTSDPLIPAKYNSEAADNPEMQVEIKADGNVFDFDISTE
jgi:hypothetical protein